MNVSIANFSLKQGFNIFEMVVSIILIDGDFQLIQISIENTGKWSWTDSNFSPNCFDGLTSQWANNMGPFGID